MIIVQTHSTGRPAMLERRKSVTGRPHSHDRGQAPRTGGSGRWPGGDGGQTLGRRSQVEHRRTRLPNPGGGACRSVNRSKSKLSCLERDEARLTGGLMDGRQLQVSPDYVFWQQGDAARATRCGSADIPTQT